MTDKVHGPVRHGALQQYNDVILLVKDNKIVGTAKWATVSEGLVSVNIVDGDIYPEFEKRCNEVSAGLGVKYTYPKFDQWTGTYFTTFYEDPDSFGSILKDVRAVSKFNFEHGWINESFMDVEGYGSKFFASQSAQEQPDEPAASKPAMTESDLGETIADLDVIVTDDNITLKFLNGNKLVLQQTIASGYHGLKEGPIISVMFLERYEGEYGEETPTPGKEHFMVSGTQYFAIGDLEIALKAFKDRADSGKAYLSSKTYPGKSLEDLLPPAETALAGNFSNSARLEKTFQGLTGMEDNEISDNLRDALFTLDTYIEGPKITIKMQAGYKQVLTRVPGNAINEHNDYLSVASYDEKGTVVMDESFFLNKLEEAIGCMVSNVLSGTVGKVKINNQVTTNSAPIKE